MFRPDKILRVTSATRAVHYEPDRDFNVDAASGTLMLPPESRIPCMTQAQLAALALPRDASHLAELIAFRFNQVEIAYTHALGQWLGYAPAFTASALPRTLSALRARAPLKLLIVGDSIAAGGDASGYMNFAPHLPAFGAQVAGALERVYGAPVALENVAQAGWSSRMGVEQAMRERPGSRRPDLVIVAFGMNDVTIGRADGARGPHTYAANIAAILSAIRHDAPTAEFILVSSMFGNPTIENYPAELYPLYRDALRSLVGPGGALADLTAVWQELAARKHPLDTIANGLNHPNDFGHRLYAQTILGLLVEPPAA
jgi:lysophospholipase L1-like esterase